MDTLTYRRDVIAYQVLFGTEWIGDYASEEDAIEAVTELKNAQDEHRIIEVRRIVEEYCELQD